MSETNKMIVVTTPTVPEKNVVRTLGLVRGNTIRARHVGKDIMAGLRSIVGGEVTEYAKLLAESREQAIDRMTDQAEELGANAIIGLQFQTSVIMKGAAEMMAYGTAVVVEKKRLAKRYFFAPPLGRTCIMPRISSAWPGNVQTYG